MTDPTAEFFDRVARRPHEPRLDWADGAIRFDLRDGQRTDRWLVRISGGTFRVSREEQPADVIVSIDRALFVRMVDGRENVYAAWLRDELRLAGGNPLLFFAFWRFPPLVPGPPGGHHPRSLVRARGAQS